MLPLILPPILIVVAAALLAYLFIRKLPEVERMAIERSGESPVSFLSVGDRLKRFFLGRIEWFARFSKTFSLKVHNQLNTLATRARSARLKAADRIAERKKIRLSRRSDSSIPDDSISESENLKRKQEELGSESSENTSTASPLSPPTLDHERVSQLRQWFGKRDAVKSPREEVSQPDRGFDVPEEHDEHPLVSEPLQPSSEIWTEENIRRRAADISRKFGGVVRRFRPEKTPPVFPAVKSEPAPPRKKEQLEDILVERISINPRDIEAYERLGDYYLEQENMVDAKECYRQVLKLSPAYRLVKIKIRRLERLLEKERMP
jgi:hypothetical protein